MILPPPEPAEPEGEAIPLDVVYEDDDLIVIDKPAGLVVHPAAGNRTGTLVNALIAHCGASLSGIGGVMRPGIVHRLDKDTSGLMVVAKTDRAHRSLADQFADHGRTGPLERGYHGARLGRAGPRRGHDRGAARPLDRRNREKIEVKREGGREAITHYRVVERYGATGKPPVASLVECRLETGRTHQIRVHLAAIGHPVIGDRTYGAGFATKAGAPAGTGPAAVPRTSRARRCTHTCWASSTRSSHEEMRFESPLPADIAELVEALKAL